MSTMTAAQKRAQAKVDYDAFLAKESNVRSRYRAAREGGKQ